MKMDLELTEDQSAIAAAVEQLIARHPLSHTVPVGPFQLSGDLERDLIASDFLNVARNQGYGALEALLVIEGLSRSPFVVESAASTLVLPLLGLGETVRPIALVGPPQNAPVRFLSEEGLAFIDCGDTIRRAGGRDLEVTPVVTLYGYPLSRIGVSDVSSAGEALNVDPREFRRLWRLGLVAETVGAMQAALDLTVQHVKTRHQFGQPLGALQAIQHRLAECAVLVMGSRFLMYEAAALDGAEGAALAAAYAQEAATRVVYDTHQFHGAMGLTLEYPLHYWTYRLRFLTGELGGVGGSSLAAADLTWPMDKPVAEAFRGQAV
jgi:hypothetical protein